MLRNDEYAILQPSNSSTSSRRRLARRVAVCGRRAHNLYLLEHVVEGHLPPEESTRALGGHNGWVQVVQLPVLSLQ